MTDKILIDRDLLEQALGALFMYKPMVTGVTFQHGLDAMQALRAALEQSDIEIPASVPEGWKLVPVEPTNEMVQAWLDTYEGNIQTVYRAMLAAAPQPPVVEQPQVEQEQVAWAEEIIEYLHAHYDTEMIKELDSGDALIRLDDAIAAVEEVAQRHTHPQPPRQPLTEDEVTRLWGNRTSDSYYREVVNFARAIEATHGIKERK